jgi:periplasmic protein TonB
MAALCRILSSSLTALLLASALGSVPASAESMSDWAQRAALEIRQHLRWPTGYGRAATSREAVVRFTVDRAGGVSGITLERTSGVGGFDAAALDAVRNARPLRAPPLPPGKDSITAHLTIRFQ